MRLRDTRRFKTKGVLMSFGDIMLPLVGVVAMGLLLVAGKLFFFSNDPSGNRSVPVIGPYSTTPPERPAQAQTVPPKKEEAPASEPPIAPPLSVFDRPQPGTGAEGGEGSKPLTLLDVLAVPHGNSTEKERENTPAPPQETQKAEAPPKTEKVTVVLPKKTPEATKEQPPKAQPVKATPAPKKKETPPKPTAVPAQQTGDWMVQVGAFSTREAAEAVLQQVEKGGYRAKIIPGKTLNRVLLQAGPTRDEALSLATKLSKAGFQGAFIVPPR